jgi:1-acyl-sn-glycerol-3-phosphate acyltransferase
MQYLFIIPRTLWKILFMLNFALMLIILSPLIYVFFTRKKLFPKSYNLTRFLSYCLVTIPGIFVTIRRETPANQLPKTAIYCSNHSSYLDIILAFIVIKNHFISLGKKALEKVPVLRMFFKNVHILVDRKSVSSSHKAFLRLAKYLDNATSILVFPEGTISNSGELLPFKNGAFKLAIDKQVPIVPITFLNNWQLLQNGGFLKAKGHPGICRIVVHEPIYTAGMSEKDLLSLRTKVYDVISNELEKYNSRK